MIVDLDSHLREGYFMDEVYKLDGPFAQFTPVRAGEGRNHQTRFIHSLDPGDPKGRAAHKHPYIYDPKVNWRGGEIAERQVAGYDMERRLKDIKREGIEKQIIFPTGISIPTENVGGLGFALCQAYNNWVARLVKRLDRSDGAIVDLMPVAVLAKEVLDLLANGGQGEVRVRLSDAAFSVEQHALQ